MLLEISRKTVGTGIELVALEGRLTLGEDVIQLESLLCRLVEDGGRKLVLDMAGLTYVDSAGLGALAKSSATMLQAGGKIRFAATTPRVVSAMKVTRLDRVFPLFPDLPSACKDL
jgi:anti-sigma B factor antagonist